jgi:hypothetical protein
VAKFSPMIAASVATECPPIERIRQQKTIQR